VTVLEGTSLSTADRVALVESEFVAVDAQLLLLDADLAYIDDITDDFVPAMSSVSMSIDRAVHRTARLAVSRQLVWGSQRLKPYLLLSDDKVTWYRWPLGVFLPSMPQRRAGSSPEVYEVDCFDPLDVLNSQAAATSVASGDNVVDAVEALITAEGESHTITASSTTASSDRPYPIADNWTSLDIANDLLESIGYEKLWANAAGVCRSAPYRSPADRPTVWTYSTSTSSTSVGEQRWSVRDYYRAGNVIYGINDDPANDVPVDGDGLYTLTNQSDGETSIDARGGRTIRIVVSGSYASQAALETAVQARMDAEKRVADIVELTVSPNIHSTHDVVRFIDPDLSIDGRFLVTAWDLPLGGGDMRLRLRSV